MANTKISGLSSASTPLTGSEIVPLNQSGVTDSVSVSNLTAGRAVSAASLTLSTGNVTQGASGTGYNFTANTPASGMTSQNLTWYEEGTWTPTLLFGGGNNCTYSTQVGNYTRIGRQVTLICTIALSAVGASTGGATITGFPFTSKASVPTITMFQGDSVTFVGSYPLVYQAGGATSCALFGGSNTATFTQLTNLNFSNSSTLRFVLQYFV